MAHPIRLALAGLVTVVALGACSSGSGSNESADDADQLAHNACNGLVSVLEGQEALRIEGERAAFASIPAIADPDDPWEAVERQRLMSLAPETARVAVRKAFSSDLDPLVELTAQAAKRDASWDALHVAMTNSMVTGSKDPAIAAECTKALAE